MPYGWGRKAGGGVTSGRCPHPLPNRQCSTRCRRDHEALREKKAQDLDEAPLIESGCLHRLSERRADGGRVEIGKKIGADCLDFELAVPHASQPAFALQGFVHGRGIFPLVGKPNAENWKGRGDQPQRRLQVESEEFEILWREGREKAGPDGLELGFDRRFLASPFETCEVCEPGVVPVTQLVRQEFRKRPTGPVQIAAARRKSLTVESRELPEIVIA